MNRLFSPDRLAQWQARLPRADPALAADRQPLHVVYGGANRFVPDIAAKLGQLALRSMNAYAPDSATFARAMGLSEEAGPRIHARVIAKLKSEPVEDYRIDFEDGYGARADDEEDRHASAVGEALAQGAEAGQLPPMIGIRIKALSGPTAARGLSTLDRVFAALAIARPPAPFFVTLPKVRDAESVRVAAEALAHVEDRRGWPTGSLRLEVMVEDPRVWFDPAGRFRLPDLLDAGDGRISALHLGPYDYTAALGIAGDDQALFHPALEVARHLLQVSVAGTAVRLGDGPTMLMPIGPHRAFADRPLTEAQAEENQAVVHRAWRHHADAVRASMQRGFDLGWDLHPAQIPARLAAVYAAYDAQLPSVATRLRNFIDDAGQATRVGAVFDDAATGQGLVNFCLRAMATGALSEERIVEATGVSRELLATRSFTTIVRAANTPTTASAPGA